MNSNQIQSFVRWLLNALSGAVISYTASKSDSAKGLGQYLANLITGPDAIAAATLAITWFWGHIKHRDISDTNADGGTIKRMSAIALICGLSFGLTGCVTPQNPTGTVAIGGVNIDPAATGNAVQIAAKLGAMAAIQSNPDSRQFFQISVGVIDAAIATGDYNPTNLQSSLEAATGDTIVAESIADALSLYQDFFGKVTSSKLSSQSPYTVPVLTGLAAGLQQAVDLTATK